MSRDRFDHLFIAPSNFDRAVAFYRESLGWSSVATWGGGGEPRGVILLWQTASMECRERGHTGAFTVNSSNNAVAVYERLGFRRTAPVQDNDGVLFNPMASATDA